MPQTRAVYSVVQYVPDSGRAEAANAGVVLFVPSAGWMGMRRSITLDRIRQCFRPTRKDMRRIELALESLEQRLESNPQQFADEQEFDRFVAARADAIRLTPGRVAMVTDFARDLESLFLELVGDADAKAEFGQQVMGLPPHIAEVFARLRAASRAWEPRKITLPITGRPYPVDVAFDNGRRNYVKAESFASDGRIDGRLQRLGFNGRLIYQHQIENRDSQLVVVSADPSARPDAEHKARSVLADFNVRFVAHSETASYAKEVELTAH